MSRASLFAALPLLASPAAARADRVDEIIRRTMAGAHIPGMTVLVTQEGKVLRAKSYGVTNLEAKSPARRDTVWEIGSVSKQFTSAAVLLLVQDGKLSLDDPLEKHLTDLPEKWKPLTLRQVLSHTSGLKDTMQALDAPNFKAKDYWTKMGPLPLDFETGTSWSYSNLGFNLAADVVESVSGTRIGAFLDERVFKPLKMEKTAFTDPAKVFPGRARGYAWAGKNHVNIGATNPATCLGAGAIMSTADDLAKWNDGLWGGKVLKPETLRQFLTPVKLNDGRATNYALGWFVTQDQGRPILEHGGNTMGFSCDNMRLPEEKANIIVLSNSSGVGMATVARAIAAEMFPAYDLTKRKPTPDPDPKATANLMLTLRQFGRSNYRLDAFTPSMRGTLGSLRGALTKMSYGGLGKQVQTYEHLDSEPFEGGRLSRYRFRTKGADLFVQVQWSPEGLVERVDVPYTAPRKD